MLRIVPSDTTSEPIAMFQDLPNAERIELARTKMKKVIDHLLYVLERSHRSLKIKRRLWLRFFS